MGQKVGFELEIETKKSTRDAISDIELQLHEVNKELREAKKLGQTDVYKSLRAQQQGLKDEAKKLTRELKEQDTQLSDLVDNFRIGFVRIGDFKAGLANTQKSMGVLTKAIKANIVVTKLWKAVLISSGVGALVVALGSLAVWLTKTQKGMDFVARASAALESVMGNLIDAAVNLGKGLGYIFTFRFGKGFERLGKAVKGATYDLIVQAAEAGNLTGKLQDLAQEEIGLNAILAERRNKLKDLSKTIENQAATEEERIAAGKEAMAITQQVIDIENSFLDRKIEALQQIKGLNDSNREDDEEIAALVQERFDRETSNLELQTTIQNKLNAALGISKKATKELGDEAEKAASGSIKALQEQLAKINEEIQGGKFTQEELDALIRKRIDVEESIAKGLQRIEESANRLTRGITPTNFDKRATAGVYIEPPENDIRVQREKDVIETLKDLQETYGEFEKKKAEEQLEIEKDIANRRQAIREEAYEGLGSVLGDFYTGEIENYQEYAKASLAVLVEAVEKQVQISLAGLLPDLIGKLGPVKGTLAFISIQGLVKAALNKAKSAAQLEKGGTINEGFVANGPRHAHGGIPIGNGQEIEGGEAVINRRSTAMFPDVINAINMAGGGRRILADGGIIGGSAGPVLPASFFNQGSGIDGDALSKQILSAVRMGIGLGLMDGNRRLEREAEFQNRNIA